MNATPSSPSEPGSTTSETATTGSQIAAAAVEKSQTNVAPPLAVFARTFQAAWASAARTTRTRTKVGTEGSSRTARHAGRTEAPSGLLSLQVWTAPNRGRPVAA